ncbi:hypothetical protein GFY24_09330 [Nocardia sp. SYP-A9097]|uniref:hypothetical protein n=1 Tax=Nocardia sp. SYP-A9097 TaxID=2663237 RepID=UPI00129B6E00|nr:hypothetical protein [Nocardia sp. SYP-A9097]MRH87650.1 hypothetical protein [Nocardia sp. SYP-A9097]
MVDEFWAELQRAVPEILCAEYDDDFNQIQLWSFVRLRDTGTGSEIVFSENGKTVEVGVPGESAAAQQLTRVLLSHPVWYSPMRSGQRWMTRWRLPSEDGFLVADRHYAEAATGVIAVMRDGLRMDPARMRYTAGDRNGPRNALSTLCLHLTADRPTKRNAPERCTDWGDFAERLDWTLRTLPYNDVTCLEAPAIENHNGLEFIEGRGRLEAATIAENVEGPDLARTCTSGLAVSGGQMRWT